MLEDGVSRLPSRVRLWCCSIATGRTIALASQPAYRFVLSEPARPRAGARRAAQRIVERLPESTS